MIDCVNVQPHQFVFNWPTLGPFFQLLEPLELFVELGSGPKNFFGTYLGRQLTLVLEVQSYLFFNWATFGASFALF